MRAVAPRAPARKATQGRFPAGTAPIAPAGLARLLRHVARTQGLRCDLYRDRCLLRRLDARVRRLGMRSYAEYLCFLRENPPEQEALIAALTVHVSRFFRNAESFRALARQVLPELAGQSGRREVRVWSAGTADGAEAYTLAMLWTRLTERTSGAPVISILATDVDSASLARAAAASYEAAALAEVGAADRQRWLVAEGERYRVRPEIRGRVRFRRADLTGPIRLRSFDLIVCRNVLIYFQRILQESVCESFYRALRPGGFLMLGKVEMLTGASRRLFEVVDGRERLFRKPRLPGSRECPCQAAGR